MYDADTLETLRDNADEARLAAVAAIAAALDADAADHPTLDLAAAASRYSIAAYAALDAAIIARNAGEAYDLSNSEQTATNYCAADNTAIARRRQYRAAKSEYYAAIAKTKIGGARE